MKNPSLVAYAQALAKELASGKSFPTPDPALRRRLRQADARDPNADLKAASAILQLRQEAKLSDAAQLENANNAKTRGKYRNVHSAGKYGGE